MSQVFDVALTGLAAAQTMLGATANNLANSDTPGFKSSRADLVELSGGGVAAYLFQDNSPATTEPVGTPGSNVDFARESINLTRAKLLYTANAALIRIGDRMTGTLLDMMDDGKGKK